MTTKIKKAATAPTAEPAEAAIATPAAPAAKARKPAAPNPLTNAEPPSVPEPASPVAGEAEAKPEKKAKKEKGKDKDKKKKKKKKEAVLMRFEDHHLNLIDARAESLGLSRAAWVRMVVAQALSAG